MLFDRSWYNRAMVEPVFGFCTDMEYQNFMRGVSGFEKGSGASGTIHQALFQRDQRKSRHDASSVARPIPCASGN